MIALPVSDGVTGVLILVLDDENVGRMKDADPVDLDVLKYFVAARAKFPVSKFELLICYEKDIAPLVEMQRRNDLKGIFDWLQRGRKLTVDDCHEPTSLSRKGQN